MRKPSLYDKDKFGGSIKKKEAVQVFEYQEDGTEGKKLMEGMGGDKGEIIGKKEEKIKAKVDEKWKIN